MKAINIKLSFLAIMFLFSLELEGSNLSTPDPSDGDLYISVGEMALSIPSNFSVDLIAGESGGNPMTIAMESSQSEFLYIIVDNTMTPEFDSFFDEILNSPGTYDCSQLQYFSVLCTYLGPGIHTISQPNQDVDTLQVISAHHDKENEFKLIQSQARAIVNVVISFALHDSIRVFKPDTFEQNLQDDDSALCFDLLIENFVMKGEVPPNNSSDRASFSCH
ncbi:hypothetical protein CWE15_11055 [Aliidiomarina taiwanensis]|uniref:Uncharacterized protein n=1 Tax=Aliidiomarina taiwanensis TaxID=946228 RepID=A0A432WVV4_9GAMM|nr:hypothetical protein [Aliidiomarina taiwanensis]RUO37891.1 hypothetical protein CWE15_11055 [Aliidiomarina taiwanensis]